MRRLLLLLVVIGMMGGCGNELESDSIFAASSPSPTGNPSPSSSPSPASSPSAVPSPSPVAPSPSPTPATGTVIVRFVLARAVPTFVQTLRVTFLGPEGVLQGPLSQARTAELSFSNVPTRATSIQIDYLIGTTVIGIFRGPLAFNGTAGPIVISDPDFVDVDTLAAIALDPPQARVPLGRISQYEARGRFSDGKTYDLSNSVSWTSTNTSAATITNTGLLTTRATGASVIRAALNNVTGSTNLTVLNATITSLDIEPNHVTNLGALQNRQLQAMGTFSDGSRKDLTTQVNWRSSNLQVASIAEDGLLSAVASGDAVVNATLGSVVGNCTVQVVGPNLLNLTVEPGELTINRLSSAQLTARGRFSDGSTRDLTTNVTWTSSLPSVASVNSATGLLNGLIPGLARIRAHLGLGSEAFASVTVVDIPIPGPSPSPTSPGGSPSPAPSPRRQDYVVGAGPEGIVSADLNGDGRPDLAVTEFVDQTSDGASVLLNGGGANFGPRTTYRVGGAPYGLAAGRFRTGMAPDLAVANSYDGDVTVLLNSGSGTFPSNLTTGGLGCDPFAVAVADFNGDSHQDMALALISSFEVQILLGDGTGNFTLGDFFQTGVLPAALAVGNFDSRNGLDIAVANQAGGSITVGLNNGSGDFTASEVPINAECGGIVTADFNSDGRLDLAVTDGPADRVAILTGNGSGGFTETGSFAVGSCPGGLAVGDFNADGRLDLVAANCGDDTATTLLGQGGTFLPGTTWPVGRSPAQVVTGDFDGDGRSDFATSNADEDTITVWTGVH